MLTKGSEYFTARQEQEYVCSFENIILTSLVKLIKSLILYYLLVLSLNGYNKSENYTYPHFAQPPLKAPQTPGVSLDLLF